MQEMPKAKNHTVMLDNRGKLVMTGTEDVSGFNEETVLRVPCNQRGKSAH